MTRKCNWRRHGEQGRGTRAIQNAAQKQNDSLARSEFGKRCGGGGMNVFGCSGWTWHACKVVVVEVERQVGHREMGEVKWRFGVGGQYSAWHLIRSKRVRGTLGQAPPHPNMPSLLLLNHFLFKRYHYKERLEMHTGVCTYRRSHLLLPLQH